jgi:hypothetical protein
VTDPADRGGVDGIGDVPRRPRGLRGDPLLEGFLRLSEKRASQKAEEKEFFHALYILCIEEIGAKAIVTVNPDIV